MQHRTWKHFPLFTILLLLLDHPCFPHSIPTVQLILDPSRVPQKSTVTLLCKLGPSTRRNATLTYWEKDGTTITGDSQRFDLKYHETGSVLQIRRVRAKDEGRYACVAHFGGENSTVRDYKTLHVLVPPTIYNTTDGVVVNEGDSATLECLCIHCLYVHWEHEGASLDTTQRYRSTSKGAYLSIRSVKGRDHGNFTCTAYNERFQSQRTVSLTVRRKPVITIHPRNTVVTPGDTAIIMCQAESYPPSTLQWRFNGEVIDYDKRPNLVHSEGKLEIGNANGSDRGHYRCMARNSLGNMWSEARLDVEIPLKEVNVGRREVMFGDDVLLTCPNSNSSSSVGSAKVLWSAGGCRVDSEMMPRYKELDNGSLHISNVQYNDESSSIICAVKNSQSHHMLMTIARMRLVVNEPMGMSRSIVVENTADFVAVIKWNLSVSLSVLETISQLKVIVRSKAGELYRTVIVNVDKRNVSLTNIPEDDYYRVQIDFLMKDGKYMLGKEETMRLVKTAKTETPTPVEELMTITTPTKNLTLPVSLLWESPSFPSFSQDKILTPDLGRQLKSGAALTTIGILVPLGTFTLITFF